MIDAAERLPREVQKAARGLITAITHGTDGSASNKWRVVIVGQTEAWSEGAFSEIADAARTVSREVRSVVATDVKAALQSSPRLGWATSHDEIVALLSNLRTLAWVLAAEGRFQSTNAGALASNTTIADHLWRFWTDGKIVFQNLLIRLAEREANFEHSFEISRFDPKDAATLDARPAQMPLRVNARNRVEFQHDLAAEWARFQRLKEIADQPEQWASYAGRPLWTGALHMLGGYLLRETINGRSAWDVVFEKLETDKQTLAADIMLDALCLDPFAELFLTARADLLFADHGRLLNRLLKRFLHIATRPGGGGKALADFLSTDTDFTLYIETQFRQPVVARWPPIGRFLHAHRDRVAGLVSPTVAELCLKWLTSLPVTVRPGEPVPFRREFAEVALATARALQLEELKRDIIHTRDFGKSIYPAALAGARDLPTEVSAWAFEMARRRALNPDLKKKLADHRQEKAREHQEKLRTDAEYRQRFENRERVPPYIPSGRRLPPWPLGPAGRVDHEFSECCTNAGGLTQLMQTRPDVAAEVLLAILIEGEPEERYGDGRFDERLGLQFDNHSYPTAFWKSPFFAFLQINTDVALETLVRLVCFCTEHWNTEWQEAFSEAPPSIKVSASDGIQYQFLGDQRVFAWSQTSASHAGQLHSALAALERYFTLRIEAGADIAPDLERVKLTGNSAGLLGVLINIGKYKPELFLGVLRPLVTSSDLYNWDDERIDALEFAFAAPHWARQGDLIFNMAREWHNAPYRHRPLREVVAELGRSDAEFASFVNDATAKWPIPSDTRSALELQLLAAQLDSRNYRTTPEGIEFVLPAELDRGIDAFNNARQPVQQTLQIPRWCWQFLRVNNSLNDASAEALATMLDTVTTETRLRTDFKARARVAIASTLLARGTGWLDAHTAVRDQSVAILDEALSQIPTTIEERRAYRPERTASLDFVVHAAFARWMQGGSIEAEAAVLRIVTSDDLTAVASLFQLAHANRANLGERWWRLLYLGLLWSALSMLMPRYGYQPDDGARWVKWLDWMRTRRLDGVVATLEQIEPIEIAKRLERLERVRWRREFRRRGAMRPPSPDQRRTAGLNWDFLGAAFSWLWWEGETTNPLWDDELAFREQRQIILALWTFEVWLHHRPRSGKKDDRVPEQLAYNVMQTMARMITKASPSTAQELWQPVFKLGAAGHYAVQHFISCWFFETTRLDPTEFAARWQPMIEYALNAPEWGQGQPWYYGQSMLRQILGFRSETNLNRYPLFQGIVDGMAHHYERWALEHLSREEDNVTGLCFFLASSTGCSLRIRGLGWLQEAVAAEPWYRAEMGNALVEFLNATLTQDADELRANVPARDALLDLVAILVSKQVAAALALQERARRLLSNA
ncbi:MAG: hypothetical protein WBD95_12965 [Xanthobacteraceae bacterium]